MGFYIWNIKMKNKSIDSVFEQHDKGIKNPLSYFKSKIQIGLNGYHSIKLWSQIEKSPQSIVRELKSPYLNEDMIAYAIIQRPQLYKHFQRKNLAQDTVQAILAQHPDLLTTMLKNDNPLSQQSISVAIEAKPDVIRDIENPTYSNLYTAFRRDINSLKHVDVQFINPKSWFKSDGNNPPLINAIATSETKIKQKSALMAIENIIQSSQFMNVDTLVRAYNQQGRSLIMDLRELTHIAKCYSKNQDTLRLCKALNALYKNNVETVVDISSQHNISLDGLASVAKPSSINPYKVHELLIDKDSDQQTAVQKQYGASMDL